MFTGTNSDSLYVVKIRSRSTLNSVDGIEVVSEKYGALDETDIKYLEEISKLITKKLPN